MTDIIPQTVLNKVRRDKFVLVLDTPPVLKDDETATIRGNEMLNRDKMQFSVIGVNLPAHNIPSVNVPYRGQTAKFTSQTRVEYPPATVNFTVDNNFDNYWFLWKWLYVMNHPRESGMDKHFTEFTKLRKTQLDSARNAIENKRNPSNQKPITFTEIKMKNDYSDYQSTITLYGLREYNEKIIRFDYYDAFISSLGEIVYDYREIDEIACSFDFSFGQIDITLIDPL